MSLTAPAPQDLILVGATGDLAQRKVLPALNRLAAEDLLPPDSRIIGYARSMYSDEQFRNLVAGAVRGAGGHVGGDAWEHFAKRLTFVCDVVDSEGHKLVQHMRASVTPCGTTKLRSAPV